LRLSFYIGRVRLRDSGNMFSSGTEFLQEVAGVSGSALVPTRFVWPYGGRRVFLTGSFTRSVLSSFPFTSVIACFLTACIRWSEHLPMSPAEGCPTVFQVICSLTPGLHQVAVSDGTMQDTALRISEVDIKISRHRISTFLSAHTAYDLLPNSGKVIALDVNLPVKQAFHILYEQFSVVKGARW
ncbi:hypothetical protein GW17_00048187, partial [Ensete ventricosum]